MKLIKGNLIRLVRHIRIRDKVLMNQFLTSKLPMDQEEVKRLSMVGGLLLLGHLNQSLINAVAVKPLE
jgi:hypothetical protein